MLNWGKGEVRRFRRSVAHGGLLSALGWLGWRLVHRNAPRVVEEPVSSEAHPFDLEAGVETSGLIHGGALATGHANDVYIVAYYGASPSLFRSAMKRWQDAPGVRPAEEYTFIDIGCGKGRAVMMASGMGFRECIGVELVEELATVAETNVARFVAMGRQHSPMRIVCADALAFEYPATRCVVFLFNPFTGKMLAKFLKRLAAAFRGRPGELEIVYLNSRYREELEAEPGFEMLWEAALEMSEEDARLDRQHLGEGPDGGARKEMCSAWRWVGV